MRKKLVISAMVVSYDAIRGQETLQKASILKRHIVLSHGGSLGIHSDGICGIQVPAAPSEAA